MPKVATRWLNTFAQRLRPAGQIVSGNIFSLIVQQIGPGMQRVAHFFEVASCCRRAALFVALDRLAQDSSLLHVPGGRLSALAYRKRNQYGERQEKRLGHPVGKKNLEKQTPHGLTFSAATSCGRVKMYPTPRTVLMWSTPESESPSFLRILLTCMSMLRSKGENLRLNTISTRRSRGTTRPASRNSTCNRLNSTEVNSTCLPFCKTVRVAGSSSTSPTRRISEGCPLPDLSEARVRRRMARMRATSSRGLKGLGR